MTTPNPASPLVLVPGHWLGAWAWDEVREHLDARGLDAAAVTLPGFDPLDPLRATRTVDDQAAALREVVAAAGGSAGTPVVVVAHSGANAPVSLLLDASPELVRHVVWVDSGPLAPGTALAPDLPETVDELPLPPFETLSQQASLEGLGEAVLERFRARAVPVPAPVLRRPVVLTDDARRRVPATLVCCSISGEQVRDLAGAGHPVFAEVARLEHVEVVDLPTGHWPMWSRPGDLAEVVAATAAAPA